MKKKNLIYGLLCVVGGILIGFFANQLDTVLGCILFVLGIMSIVFSSIMLGK